MLLQAILAYVFSSQNIHTSWMIIFVPSHSVSNGILPFVDLVYGCDKLTYSYCKQTELGSILEHISSCSPQWSTMLIRGRISRHTRILSPPEVYSDSNDSLGSAVKRRVTRELSNHFPRDCICHILRAVYLDLFLATQNVRYLFLVIQFSQMTRYFMWLMEQ